MKHLTVPTNRDIEEAVDLGVSTYITELRSERDTLRKLNKESCEMAIKAYEERDALQARLDEAVELLRRIYYRDQDATFNAVANSIRHEAWAFLSTLENGGA